MQPETQFNHSKEKPKLTPLNKEEWLKHIKDWEDSGLSQKAFCEHHGLNFNTFYYLRSKLLAKQKQSTPVGFAPVKLDLADHELLLVLGLLGW